VVAGYLGSLGIRKSMSPTLIATIVAVVLLIGIVRLFLGPKLPPASKFKCARCGVVESHNERTEKAWRGGLKAIFCNSCHRKWLAAQPQQRPTSAPGSSRRLAANRGCLGVAILFSLFPLAMYWAYAYA
jgi:hypothetical protein